MQLKDLVGNYDAVFSLGQNCSPAVQMRQIGLRPFSGMLDWMVSDHLSDVNRLISSGFHNFMELDNMRITGYTPSNQDPPAWLMVEDITNRIVSMHDFQLTHNTLTELHTYSEFKAKMNRRIARFYNKAATCQKILFIRLFGEYEDVQTLQSILRWIVKNDFRILIVNYSPDTQGIVDLNWSIDKVCAVRISNQDVWNTSCWQEILKGVRNL